MVELRQIQYFVICAQTGSFSRAAEQLYTTQPNVSKVIRAMEAELGEQLFERYTKGIRLTAKGEHVYKYARPVLENLKRLQVFEAIQEKTVLSISCNPSSWFADMFVEYYQKHREEEIQYQIYSTGTQEIVKRVKERSDDIGFVYVMKNQLTAFLYFLSRNYLEFVTLEMTDVMLYPGAEYTISDRTGSSVDFAKLRLIQCFPDEFSMNNYWNIQDKNGRSAADAEIAVTTNSDYIMERILQTSDLVNISGNYLTGDYTQSLVGIKLSEGGEQKILFGYVRRRGEALSEAAEHFVSFLDEKLTSGTHL